MSEEIDTSCSIVLEKLNSDVRCSSLLLRTLLFCYSQSSSVFSATSCHCVIALRASIVFASCCREGIRQQAFLPLAVVDLC